MKASDRDKIAKPKSFLQGAWRNTRASHVTVNGYWAIYKNANNFPHSPPPPTQLKTGLVQVPGLDRSVPKNHSQNLPARQKKMF